MSNRYRFSLEKSEVALNIVLGSALGAYLGVALSIGAADIDVWSFAGFLLVLTGYIRSLLLLQHYSKEKYWRAFFAFLVILAPLLQIVFQLSKKLPINSSVFLSIAGIWLISIVADTIIGVLADRFMPRREGSK